MPSRTYIPWEQGCVCRGTTTGRIPDQQNLHPGVRVLEEVVHEVLSLEVFIPLLRPRQPAVSCHLQGSQFTLLCGKAETSRKKSVPSGCKPIKSGCLLPTSILQSDRYRKPHG